MLLRTREPLSLPRFAANPILTPLMVILLAMLIGHTTPVLGQDETKSEQKEADTAEDAAVAEKPALKAFNEMFTKIRKTKRQINLLFANMPVGFPKEQEEQFKKINFLRNALAEFEFEIHRLAVDAYLESPNVNPVVNEALLKTLNRSLAPMTIREKFDPKTALEITSAMDKNGVKSPGIMFAGFRAAYALQDFERAELMLEKLKKLNAELQPEILTQLETTKKNWQRELMIRQQEAEADDLPRVLVETTSGSFTIELFENQAPNTVANFINLVESGYYNDNTFHFVQPSVLAQTGCPDGTGDSDPGYRIPCECYKEDKRHHFAGSVSMRTNGKDTGGAIFFVTHQPNNFLDGKYTVFGRVIENFDTVLKLNSTRLPAEQKPEPSVITNISVTRKRDHEYTPKTLPLTTENDGTSNSSSTPAGSSGG